MAVAYKCDRCGKLYEVNIISHENVGKFFIGYKNSEGDIGNIDLCGNCQKSFELFLHKKAFTADEVHDIVCKHGQNDRQFNLGETIKYSPSEICKILMEDGHNG